MVSLHPVRVRGERAERSRDYGRCEARKIPSWSVGEWNDRRNRIRRIGEQSQHAELVSGLMDSKSPFFAGQRGKASGVTTATCCLAVRLSVSATSTLSDWSTNSIRLDKAPVVVFASASEVMYWPVVLSKGTRMTLGAAVGTTHTVKPEVLSGTTASEIVLFGNSQRNEACPRTAPLTSMLAQPCDSVGKSRAGEYNTLLSAWHDRKGVGSGCRGTLDRNIQRGSRHPHRN